MTKGRDLILDYNGTPLAAAKSCKVDTDSDYIEVCSPTDGTWKEYIPTTQEWGASADCLVAEMEDVDKLFDYKKNQTPLSLQFYDTSLMTFYSGRAYIKKLSITGNVGSNVTMSVVFQPTGELVRAQSQVLNLRDVGESYEQTVLDWSGSEVVVRSNSREDYEEGRYVVAYELTVTKDTRITALFPSIVVKGSLSTIGPMIANNNTQGILERAMIVNYGNTRKSVIVPVTRGSETVTLLINYYQAYMPYNFIYLSKL